LTLLKFEGVLREKLLEGCIERPLDWLMPLDEWPPDPPRANEIPASVETVSATPQATAIVFVMLWFI